MRLLEHEGKQLLAEHGLAVPRGGVADTPEQAAAIAASLGGAVVVKAQVPVGGRGKAGGIRMAAGPAGAAAAAAGILGASIRGLRARQVLVEERLAGVREYYIGVTVDSAAGRPVALAGRGGVEVEERSAADPAAMASARLDPLAGLPAALSHDLVSRAGLERPEVAGALVRLYEVFVAHQALLAEVNPLVELADGALVAADARVELDDAVAAADPRWRAQAEGRAAAGGPQAEVAGGMTYVEGEGEIGIICSGAGLGMATMDLISERARPANFLETGGGITRQLMRAALERVLRQKGLKGILINVYGGINPIHEGALGVADVMAAGVPVPVVAKALGHRQEETWEILRRAGVRVYEGLDTEGAVDQVVDLALGVGRGRAEGTGRPGSAPRP
ncbi:MAG: ATP-grasp domain-containing protein [Gemmatimonadota bacterium]